MEQIVRTALLVGSALGFVVGFLLSKILTLRKEIKEIEVKEYHYDTKYQRGDVGVKPRMPGTIRPDYTKPAPKRQNS